MLTSGGVEGRKGRANCGDMGRTISVESLITLLIVMEKKSQCRAKVSKPGKVVLGHPEPSLHTELMRLSLTRSEQLAVKVTPYSL